MKKVKAVYLQAGENIYPDIVEIMPDGSNLDEIYKLLKCDTIDIVSRPFGIDKKMFNVILDDNGRLKDKPIPSALNIIPGKKDFSIDFVGNLLICGFADEEGNLTDLSLDDICKIKNQVILCRVNSEKDLFKQKSYFCFLI